MEYYRYKLMRKKNIQRHRINYSKVKLLYSYDKRDLIMYFKLQLIKTFKSVHKDKLEQM